MPRLPRKLTRMESEFADEWNAMVDYLRSLTPRASAGTLFEHSTFGVTRKALTGSAHGSSSSVSSSSVKLCQIQSYGQDHYVVKEWDGSAVVGDAFNVAKPLELRGSVTSETTVDSVSYSYSDYVTPGYTERTATSGDKEEVQVIVPPYKTNQLIMAEEVVVTGVSVSGTPLTWIEVDSPRAWARKAVQP